MDAHRVAFNTWQEKTEWVQKDKRFDILLHWGKHRADVLKEYIDHLEAKCAALAAENAGLKAENAEGCKWDGEQWVGLSIETPTTDAFLAEVRAQGVDSAINTVIAMMNHQHPVTSKAIDILRTHAYQVRKGVPS